MVLSRPMRDCIFHPSFGVIVIQRALIFFGEFIEKFKNFPTRLVGVRALEIKYDLGCH